MTLPRFLSLFFAACIALPCAADAGADTAWLASWSASPQAVWSSDFILPANVPARLHDQTVRQVARISMGGQRVRIVLSNADGATPLTTGAATLALAADGSVIVPGSLRAITFGGRSDATIAPGAALVSDPVALAVPDLARLTVSLHVPQDTAITSFHWDGRETAWIAPGQQTGAGKLDATRSITTTARLLLSSIEVEATAAAQAVAVLGDSITDGAGASLGRDTRWPDVLAERLAPHGVAVINAGISGARLLADGMGSKALARLERDVLGQPGVRTVIVALGINDISWPGTAFDPHGRRPTLEELMAGYRQLTAQARSRGVRVIGATLTPFDGALPGTPLADYHDAGKDDLRQRLNAWIRSSGSFDAVLDADALLPAYDSGDHLHPGDAGNRALADAVDLRLLTEKP